MTGTSEYSKEYSMTAKCKEFLAKLQDIPLSEGICFMELVGQHVSKDRWTAVSADSVSTVGHGPPKNLEN
jgi:hypothetical protein